MTFKYLPQNFSPPKNPRSKRPQISPVNASVKMVLTGSVLRENFKRRKAQEKLLKNLKEMCEIEIPIRIHDDGRPVTPTPTMIPTLTPTSAAAGEQLREQHKTSPGVEIQVTKGLSDPRIVHERGGPAEVLLQIIPWSNYGEKQPEATSSKVDSGSKRRRAHRRTRQKQRRIREEKVQK